MQDDINTVLALEIKKEMADRYFGFRRLIEEDIQDYDDRVLASHVRLEQKIGFDLVRLYILLKDETLIHEFFQLAGLDRLIFYDPYLTESPSIRKRVFAGQRIRGLTRIGRFKNMVFDTYENLARDIDEYRDNMMKLAGERETIVEEIKLFHKKHDLGTMMDFLRGLEGNGVYTSGPMAGGILARTGEKLDQKMQVKPPPPLADQLPDIPPVSPLPEIKKPLKKIVDRAFRGHGNVDIKDFVQP